MAETSFSMTHDKMIFSIAPAWMSGPGNEATQDKMTAKHSREMKPVSEKKDHKQPRHVQEKIKVNPVWKELPSDFVPGEYDVICARGKEAKHHPGNKRLKELVLCRLEQYCEARSKLGKSKTVLEIISSVKLATPDGGFVRELNGKYYEVGIIFAREKIGQIFRDQLHVMYASSSRSKQQQRHVRNELPKSKQVEDKLLKATAATEEDVTVTQPCKHPQTSIRSPTQQQQQLPVVSLESIPTNITTAPQGLILGTTSFILTQPYVATPTNLLPHNITMNPGFGINPIQQQQPIINPTTMPLLAEYPGVAPNMPASTQRYIQASMSIPVLIPTSIASPRFIVSRAALPTNLPTTFHLPPGMHLAPNASISIRVNPLPTFQPLVVPNPTSSSELQNTPTQHRHKKVPNNSSNKSLSF